MTKKTKPDVVAFTVGAVTAGFMYPYAGADLPEGFLWCDGAEHDRLAHQPLFAVIGTTYGAGDGVQTFNVPDCRGRAVVGVGQGATAEGGGTGTARTLGQKGGAESHTLTAAQMPAHTHGVTYDKTTYQADATISLLGSGNRVTGFAATNVTSTSVGSGSSHNNMSPFIAINWIIRAV